MFPEKKSFGSRKKAWVLEEKLQVWLVITSWKRSFEFEVLWYVRNEDFFRQNRNFVTGIEASFWGWKLRFQLVKTIQIRGFVSNLLLQLKFKALFPESKLRFWNRSLNAWKEAKYGVFSGPYSVQIQENTDEKKLRIWTLFTQCFFRDSKLRC